MPSSDVALQLRAARPHAPEGLRERVRALPEPAATKALRLPSLRVALVLAGAVIAAGVSAAVVHGLVTSGSGHRRIVALQRTTITGPPARTQGGAALAPRALRLGPFVPGPTRLQRFDASMRIGVKNLDDLSRATKAAMRTARSLGGFVASASYNAPGGRRGESTLLLRIPVGKLPTAIAQLSDLGTILAQQVQIEDVQRQVDLDTRQIRALRKQAAQLRAQIGAATDPAERQRLQAQLDYVLGELTALQRGRRDTIRNARLAHVSVVFTTRKAAAAPPPGRLHRTLDDAGSVLAREGEVLLYALVVAGPLLALGAALLAVGRTWSRRADRRLLERT
ncbi:MAG: DUF4349 domain-containing protein [Gaiellaceae bacterium]